MSESDGKFHSRTGDVIFYLSPNLAFRPSLAAELIGHQAQTLMVPALDLSCDLGLILSCSSMSSTQLGSETVLNACGGLSSSVERSDRTTMSGAHWLCLN